MPIRFCKSRICQISKLQESDYFVTSWNRGEILENIHESFSYTAKPGKKLVESKMPVIETNLVVLELSFFRIVTEFSTFFCSSQKICSTPGLKKKRGSTSSRGWCNIPILTSWMSSAQDVTRSLQFSAMHRPLFFASVAPLSSVNLLEAELGSQKVLNFCSY